MRQRYCKMCGDWHDVEEWPQKCLRRPSEARSALPTPMLALDTMDPVQSQLDGKFYDSKAALRKTYREAGVVEVGNDSSVLNPKPGPKVKPDRKAIRESVGKALNRVGISA